MFEYYVKLLRATDKKAMGNAVLSYDGGILFWHGYIPEEDTPYGAQIREGSMLYPGKVILFLPMSNVIETSGQIMLSGSLSYALQNDLKWADLKGKLVMIHTDRDEYCGFISSEAR